MSSRIETAVRTRERRGARGTATVEAIVALPVLVLLFISVFFVRDLTLAKQDDDGRARTCAWLYSENNCAEDSVPRECAGVLGETSVVLPENSEAGAKSSDASQKLDQSQGSGRGFVVDTLSGVLDDIFGKAATARVTTQVARPSTYGGGHVTVVGKYHLACNVGETTLESMAKDAWNKINPF